MIKIKLWDSKVMGKSIPADRRYRRQYNY